MTILIFTDKYLNHHYSQTINNNQSEADEEIINV